MRSLHRLAASTLALAAALPTTALAQSTGENAVASAEDAFGTFTGHEQIGVYDEGNVRGFSPGTAGNYRMEGMYFDIQGSLGNRAIEGSTIRVGPAAQGYAFPAPTGIVDLQLKKAGEKLTDQQKTALRWDKQPEYLKNTQLYPVADADLDAAMQDAWTEMLQQ